MEQAYVLYEMTFVTPGFFAWGYEISFGHTRLIWQCVSPEKVPEGIMS